MVDQADPHGPIETSTPPTPEKPRKVRRRLRWNALRRLRRWWVRRSAKKHQQAKLLAGVMEPSRPLPAPDAEELKALSLPEVQDVTLEVVFGPSWAAPQFYLSLKRLWRAPPTASSPWGANWQLSGRRLGLSNSTSLPWVIPVVPVLRGYRRVPPLPRRVITLMHASKKPAKRLTLPLINLLATNTASITAAKPTVPRPATAAISSYHQRYPQPVKQLINVVPPVRYLNTSVPLKTAVYGEALNAPVAKQITAVNHAKACHDRIVTLHDKLIRGKQYNRMTSFDDVTTRKRQGSDLLESHSPLKCARFMGQLDVYQYLKSSAPPRFLNNQVTLKLPVPGGISSSPAAKYSRSDNNNDDNNGEQHYHLQGTKLFDGPTLRCKFRINTTSVEVKTKKRPAATAFESLSPAKRLGLTTAAERDVPYGVPVVTAPPAADNTQSPQNTALLGSVPAVQPAPLNPVEQLISELPPDHFIVLWLNEVQRYWEELAVGGPLLNETEIIERAELAQANMQAARIKQNMVAFPEASLVPMASGAPMTTAASSLPRLQTPDGILHYSY